jgi:ABC-type multidrug transport system fused ATPase/permease subunit
MIIMALINACIRRVKKHANKEMSKAGGIATEVLSGIKTVASLCAQPYFEDKYQKHVRESARSSAKAAALSGLSAGIAGALFYVAYTVAFYVGTEQVVDGAQMATILNCFISGEPQCRVTGAAVMCTIYGVILCITFIGVSDFFHYSALVTSSARCVKSTQLFFVPRSSWARGSLLSILGDLRL